MKKLKTVLPVAGLVGVGAALAFANPSQSAYEKYATTQLKEYLQDNVCQEAGFLQDGCTSLVDTGNSEVEKLISSSTQRKNFGVFSIYETELSTALPFVPSYHIETLGVLNTFHTYKSETR